MTGLDAYAGQWCVVTGGAEGIGLAIARAFGAAGMRIALLDVREAAANEAAERLRVEGIEAVAQAADVSDRTSIGEAAAQLAARGVVPRMLWINAGVAVGAGVLGVRPNMAEWLYGVNALGVIWTAQAFVPAMLAGPRPAHVGVTASSAAYRSPGAPFTIYAASKHATLGLGEALRAELAEHDIGVTLFCPGLLNTAIWDGAKARPERFGGVRHLDHEVGERWRAAPTPDAAMPPLLAAVAAGGGYCAPFGSEPGSAEGFETRIAAMRGAIGPLGD